jgi:hypothetical protein
MYGKPVPASAPPPTCPWDTSRDVYLTIAAAFGVSAALENTGVAAKIANAIIGIGNSIGGTGPALIAIYIATAVMSEILTINAAGAIMYPIAAIAGEKLNIAPRDVSIAIMLGASAGFVNPFRCANWSVAPHPHSWTGWGGAPVIEGKSGGPHKLGYV